MAIQRKHKIIGITSLILLGIPLLAFLFLYHGSYSTGSRAGQVMKISHKGYFFKTWEGELNTGVNTPPWSFSVDGGNKAVISTLEEVAQTGERVKLVYEEKFVQFSWRGDTKYFVTEVDRLERK